MDDDTHLHGDDIERLFVNEDDVVAEDVPAGEPHDFLKRKLGPILGAPREEIYSVSDFSSDKVPLRILNADYGRFDGSKYGKVEPAEFDGAVTKGHISPLRRFNNIIGHFAMLENDASSRFPVTICLEPEVLDDIGYMMISVKESLDKSVRKGRLWNILDCHECTRSERGDWRFLGKSLDKNISRLMDVVSVSSLPPFSVHSKHAWLECEESKGSAYAMGIITKPEETSAVTGVMGTLHNCQVVDIAPYEPEGVPDMSKRMRYLDIPAILDPAYTPHSSEAGRVRKLHESARVRLLNAKMLEKTLYACVLSSKYEVEERDWILFCMGKMTLCSYGVLEKLQYLLRSMSAMDYTMPTLSIRWETKCAILSVTSGAVTRRDANGALFTSTTHHSGKWTNDRLNIVLPDPEAPESFDYYFNAFVKTVPFVGMNRQPRPLFAAAQGIQTVSFPFGAGSSSITPVDASIPIVSTEYLEEIYNDTSAGIPDNVAGFPVMMALTCNNDTNEDSIMISAGSAARGLFANYAYVPALLSSSEDIPEPGEKVDMRTHNWWKSYSRRGIDATAYGVKSGKGVRPLVAGGDGSGVILSKEQTQTGDYSVKVLRYSTMVTGDKLGTGHGQKGVVKVIPDEDMPWGYDDAGNEVRFDIIMSLASVVNRQTNGQYFEMVTGVKAAKSGKRIIVKPFEECHDHAETELYNGMKGTLVMRVDEGMEDVPVQASYGIAHVWALTQKTWDKQHYPHKSAGPMSISPVIGRSRGGNVKVSELDLHGAISGGLKEILDCMKSRIDMIIVDVCIKCNMLLQTCSCGESRETRKFEMPYSTMVFDFMNVLTNGYATVYYAKY